MWVGVLLKGEIIIQGIFATDRPLLKSMGYNAGRGN